MLAEDQCLQDAMLRSIDEYCESVVADGPEAMSTLRSMQGFLQVFAPLIRSDVSQVSSVAQHSVD